MTALRVLPNGRAWLWVGIFLLVGFGSVQAETWVCPDCYVQTERAAGNAGLDCNECGAAYVADELSWLIGFIDYRTRPAETSWVVLPEECDIYRPDGLQAFDSNGNELWVPWIGVEFYIPRMRLLVLRDGQELTTDYCKGPTCPKPPVFTFEITDQIRIAGEQEREQTREVEADLAELFIMARSEEAREKATARFIEEVESGKHPRLPRTDARAVREATPRIPTSLAGNDLNHDVVVHVRAGERGQLFELKLLKSCGNEELDQAALRAARSSGYFTAGELGVPVPSNLELHYAFRGQGVETNVVVPSNAIWQN